MTGSMQIISYIFDCKYFLIVQCKYLSIIIQYYLIIFDYVLYGYSIFHSIYFNHHLDLFLCVKYGGGDNYISMCNPAK